MTGKIYRLLTTLITLGAIGAVLWFLARDPLARAAGSAWDATVGIRRQAELGVAGIWLWGHQAYLGPVEPRRVGAETTKTGRGAAAASAREPRAKATPPARGGRLAAGTRRGARATPTPMPTPANLAERALLNLVSGRTARHDKAFPSRWYARPLDTRWRQYQSAPWAPIRTATHWSFLGMVGLVGFVTARRLGLKRTLKALFTPPGWALRALRIFSFSYFRPKLRAGRTYGTARWANLRELWAIRARGAQIELGRASPRMGASWARSWKLALPVVEHFYHLIVVAPPGAGKTAKLIITSILRECLQPGGFARRLGHRTAVRSFVCADAKGELAKKTSRAARKTHDVRQLAFLEPEISARYNYIAQIKTPIQAMKFAEVWVANTGQGREEFWNDLSEMMIGIGVMHLMYTDPKANLKSLYDLLYPRSSEEIVEILKNSPAQPVRDATRGLMASMAKNEKLVGAAYVDMQRRIRSIGLVPELAEVTSTDEIDLGAFGREPTALYVKFDTEHKEILSPYVSCFFAQLSESLIRQAEARGDTRLEVPVMIYLDEFANIGRLPAMARRITYMRSYGIGYFMVVQDLKQLEEVYGAADAQTIFTSAGTKIALAGVNDSDAKRFSELAGTETVLSASQGDTREITKLPWATGGSRGTSEVSRDLIDPTEIRTMGEDVLVIPTSRRPLLARPKPWFRDRRLRRLVPDLDRVNPMQDFRRAGPAVRLALPAPTEPRPTAPPLALSAAAGSIPAATEATIETWSHEQAALQKRAEVIAERDRARPETIARLRQLESDELAADGHETLDPVAHQHAADGNGAGGLTEAERVLLDTIEASPDAGTYDEIAARAGCTVGELKAHVRAISGKLGVAPGTKARQLPDAARMRGLL